uniref:Uncharacterized protein n=1 Tax=Corethron hystrix TaxID=216773 RepID=A0A7S1BKA5_9STRA|mmetsp:Transcript_29775/g.68323  ORF Transcript_29775/g.68323 Transcript_29775/m.68323 type:complete len:557 (+) Transcript_29775:150-1820(+)
MQFVRVIIFLLLCHVAEATWNIINDARVRDKNITPVLGRGYSISTGSYHSTCMNIGTITDPTSDYDYFFVEIKFSTGGSRESGGKLAKTVAAKAVSDRINSNSNSKASGGINYHRVVSVMKVDRYYTSIDETASTLTAQVTQMLSRGGIIQFFQACGPNYIRAIRRTTELAATFDYGSISRSYDGSVVDSIQNNIDESTSQERTTTTKNKVKVSGLLIRIFGYGLSLNAFQGTDSGDVSLVAKDLKDYRRVMDTALKSMQDPHGGMVRSIELVPWTSNAAFQNTLRLDTPLTRNVYRCIITDGNCTDGTDGNLATTCGYEANGTALANDADICRVDGSEDAVYKDIRKFNIVANAEFIARINAIIRQEMTALQIHMNCISQLLMYPFDLHTSELLNRRISDDNFYMNIRQLTYRLLYGENGTLPTNSNFFNDPAAVLSGGNEENYLFVRKARNILDYIQNFFERCMLKMGETKYSVASGNMQLNHWSDIPECNKIMCTLPNTAYNNGNCVAYTGDFSDFLPLTTRLDEYCPPEIFLEDDQNKMGLQYTQSVPFSPI